MTYKRPADAFVLFAMLQLYVKKLKQLRNYAQPRTDTLRLGMNLRNAKMEIGISYYRNSMVLAIINCAKTFIVYALQVSLFDTSNGRNI